MEFLSSGATDLLRLRGGQASEARARSAVTALRRAREGKGKADSAALKQAARELESFFLYLMLKTMRKTVQKSNVFGDRKKEDTYIVMLDMELSRKLANAGGIGLSPLILADFEPKRRVAEENIKGQGVPVRRGGRHPLSTSENGGPSPLPEGDASKNLPAGKTFEGDRPPNQEFFWRRPVQGRLSSHFGIRKDPFDGKRRFHYGVDVAAPAGTRVFAARPGKVIFAGKKGAYGNLVEVLHPDNSVTRYAHNSALRVKRGDAVVSGQVIAEVGASGRSAGPHLHFELVQEGRRLDPMEVFLRARI